MRDCADVGRRSHPGLRYRSGAEAESSGDLVGGERAVRVAGGWRSAAAMLVSDDAQARHQCRIAQVGRPRARSTLPAALQRALGDHEADECEQHVGLDVLPPRR